MRKVTLIFGLLFVFLAGVNAQRGSYKVFDQDSLTNADTNTYLLASDIYQISTVSYIVEIDSVSGTPAGTISYMGNNNPSATVSSKGWYPLATDTIADAANTKAEYLAPTFAARRAMIQIITSGTQLVEVNAAISQKRNY
jgi:hypothetical protein